MAFTLLQTTNFAPNTVVSYSEYSAFAANVLPKISSVQYADDTFTVLDDTAANTSGTARLVINGSGFQTGATVIVGTTSASSTARVNTEQLRANVTALSSGSYSLYVQNPDGGTAIRVNGVTFSNTPVWGTAATLTNQSANTAFGVSISANSDSAITYSNTTALPAGTTLLSNGWFYGTSTVGVETNYTFTVKATDAENQDNSRTFSLTITVGAKFSAFVWGENSWGQLGQSDVVSRSSPVQIGSLTDWAKGESGLYTMAFIKNDGTLWLQGSASSYSISLGQNDLINRSSPVQVGSGTNWSSVSIGKESVFAIKTDGTLWSFGGNTWGQLGHSDKIAKSSPVQVGSSTTWSKVQVGGLHVLATKTDGTLWAWGENQSDQLGVDASGTSRSSPVQVGALTNWSTPAAGRYTSAAIKNDGTLWMWGTGGQGVLGLNSVTNKVSPTQVGTDTTWSLVVTSGYHTLAIKTNGTLWAWGLANSGELGTNDLVARSSPIQIGSGTTWSKVSVNRQDTASARASAAIKTDNTLWLWGKNDKGQLGLNDRVYKSSPTQVTGTNWANVSIGVFSTFANRQT